MTNVCEDDQGWLDARNRWEREFGAIIYREHDEIFWQGRFLAALICKGNTNFFVSVSPQSDALNSLPKQPHLR